MIDTEYLWTKISIQIITETIQKANIEDGNYFLSSLTESRKRFAEIVETPEFQAAYAYVLLTR